jgi:hypothetical protein
MLLSGVLFVLILAGCWVYCLIDAALTPAVVFRGLPKAAWIGIIAMTFIVGGLAWLIYRAAVLTRPQMTPWLLVEPHTAPVHTYIYLRPDWDAEDWDAEADAAIARHPAGRFRKTPGDGWPALPKGPDDDPDFLRELDRRIKDSDAD